MMRYDVLRLALPALAACLLGAGSAQAQVNCHELPNPVFVGGASAPRTTIREISKILAAQNPPVTLVYQSAGSCDGVEAIANGTPMTQAAVYWPDGTQTACVFPAGVSRNLDIGVSDVFASSCPDRTGLPAGKKDFQGAVQVMTFAVPLASNQSSISAEAARVIWGFGGSTHVVAPFDNNDALHARVNSSGTKNLIARAIGLPVEKWKGISHSGSSGVTNGVTGATGDLVNKSMGILSADWTDANRDKAKILAYQHTGQSCGYLPDSSSTSLDKRNVREGRYAMWGPLHYMTNVDGAGKPVAAAGNPGDANRVERVINLFTHNGLSDADVQKVIEGEAAAFTIPLCAMKVSRTTEVGPMSPYDPPMHCGCFFESLKLGGAAPEGCATCTSDTNCSGSTSKCRFGFCEAK